MLNRLFLSVLLLGGILAVTSCSDPAGVGGNLGETPVSSDSVQARTIPARAVGTVEAVSKTGRQLSPSPGQSVRNWRFLFGQVDDPLSGPISAEGYLDFAGSAARGSSIANSPVDSLDAQLRLRLTYVHGDTSSTLDVQLYDLRTEADMDRAPADTTFSSESTAINSYQVSPTDSLLRFNLPQSWIEEHQAVLQDSSEFGDAFNGLKLTTSDGEVVVGIEHGSATLQLATRQDTVGFQSLKSFTHLEKEGTATTDLTDRTLLQGGIGPRLVIDWDFDRRLFTDTLRNVPLNKANLTVPIDTSKMDQERPANPDFVRPRVNGYRILGELTPDASSCRQTGFRQFSNDPETCRLPSDPATPPGSARLDPQLTREVLRQVLSQSPLFTRFQVEVAARESQQRQNTVQQGLPSTLPVLVRTAERFEAETRPHLELYYTPL